MRTVSFGDKQETLFTQDSAHYLLTSGLAYNVLVVSAHNSRVS